MSKWTGRVVTDTIVLDDESTARVALEDWLHDYYDVDDAEAECLSEHLTAPVLTDEARRYAMGLFGLSVEFDSERSAEAIYEYMQDRGEPATKGVSLGTASPALGDDRGEHGDEALAGAWWRCGEGWITDEADVEIAAEYLCAVAGEN